MSTDGDRLRRALGPLVDLVALTPVADEDDLAHRIERVVGAAVPVLHVDGVALTLLDESDRPRVAAASDEQASRVEREQLAADEGPGVEATRTGMTVWVNHLGAEQQHPALVGRLAAVPVGALLSTPVLVDQVVVGSLTASMREPHVWTDAQARAAAAYADVIGLALRVNARAGAAGTERQRLQQQLDLAPDEEPS